MKNLFFGCLFVLTFFFVLLFPQESFHAARSGLLLWYDTLVPTLLPVMILSNLLLRTNLAFLLAKHAARPLTAFLAITPCGAYALLTGFLCGCPMGAKVLSDLRQSGQISQAEAAYLAAFINNISPAFLTNFLVLGHLESESLLAPTLLILFGAPLLYGLFSNHRYRARAAAARNSISSGSSPDTPAIPKNKTSATAVNFAMIDVSITDSIYNITKLGGYIVLFAIFTAVADTLPLKTPLATALLAGITEVSGGIHRIAALTLPFKLKYPLLIATAAFGGLCCTAQSAQMLARAGVSLRSYLPAKAAVTAIAVIMAVCYVA